MTKESRSRERNRWCWICFECDKDNSGKKWLKPCRCKGSMKWVHNDCLMRWVDEKLARESDGQVACPVCKTKYTIIFQQYGKMFCFIRRVRRLIYSVCPFVSNVIKGCALFFSAGIYGRLTLVQVYGFETGLAILENEDPVLLLGCMPVIPLLLITFQLFSWEDEVLTLWRKYVSKADGKGRPPRPNPPLARSVHSRHIHMVLFDRVLCEALLLPTIGIQLGNLLLKNVVQSKLLRAVFGGFLYTLTKGMFTIYYKQQIHLKHNRRIIKDFEEPNDVLTKL